MKRSTIFYSVWMLFLATTLLLSCSKDDNSESVSSKQITLSVSLTGISENDETTEITRGGSQIVPATQTVTVPAGNGMSLEATLERNAPVATRGVTALAAGVKYRVIAFKQNDVGSSGYISYADYAVGTTGAIAGELHAPSGSSVTFVCYSLGTTSLPVFNKSSLDVAANPATDDLLYAKFNQTITTETHSISFTLKHQFSLVTVIADATNLALNIRSISTSLSPNYSGTLNLSTGSLTAGTSAARTISWGTVTAGQTVTAIPCAVFTNGSNAITINISSVTIWYATKSNLTATFGSDAMLPGYKYTLRLNFKKSEIAPIAAVGLSWAPGNLIGSSNGDGTFSYVFSPTQEAYSGVWDGGDYWGWCQLDPMVFTSYSGSYSAAVDPCQQVAPAGTWRMPTQTELGNLVASGHVWTSKNGVNGRYYGTSNAVTANANPNSYVFFPTSGHRNIGSTSMGNVGVRGGYWSSTPYDTTTAYNSGLGSDVTDSGYYFRNYGFTIRCVK